MGRLKIGDKVRYKEKLSITGTIDSEAIPYRNSEYSRLVRLDTPIVTPDVTINVLPFRECKLELIPAPLKVGDEIYIIEKECTGIVVRILDTDAIVELINTVYTPGIPVTFRRIVQSLSSCKRIRET